jgi:hypothetical protein
MGYILYILAITLVIIWGFGVIFNAGNLIHILIGIAFIAVLIRIIAGRRAV